MHLMLHPRRATSSPIPKKQLRLLQAEAKHAHSFCNLCGQVLFGRGSEGGHQGSLLLQNGDIVAVFWRFLRMEKRTKISWGDIIKLNVDKEAPEKSYKANWNGCLTKSKRGRETWSQVIAIVVPPGCSFLLHILTTSIISNITIMIITASGSLNIITIYVVAIIIFVKSSSSSTSSEVRAPRCTFRPLGPQLATWVSGQRGPPIVSRLIKLLQALVRFLLCFDLFPNLCTGAFQGKQGPQSVWAL